MNWVACKNPTKNDRTKWLEEFIQEGLLFKGQRLCIPRGSMRDKLICEKDSEGLGQDFGVDKTLGQLSEPYY